MNRSVAVAQPWSANFRNEGARPNVGASGKFVDLTSEHGVRW